jgi:hypothetical protein
MTKGYDGQSCSQAIEEFVRNAARPVSFSEIHAGVREKGDWKDITIWRILMSVIVNLVPARREWTHSHPFLLLRPDGRYEMHDAEKHPEVIK